MKNLTIRSILLTELRNVFPLFTEEDITATIEQLFDQGKQEGILEAHIALDEPLPPDQAEAFLNVVRSHIHRVFHPAAVRPPAITAAFHAFLENFARTQTARHGRGLLVISLRSPVPMRDMVFVPISSLQQFWDLFQLPQFAETLEQMETYKRTETFLVGLLDADGIEVIRFWYGQPTTTTLAMSA